MNPDLLLNVLHDLIKFLLIIGFILGFVSIVMWFKKKENERKAEVLLAAIEKGRDINPGLLDSRVKTGKTFNKYILLTLLVLGCACSLFGVLAAGLGIAYDLSGNYAPTNYLPIIVSLALGASLLIGYFIGKKLLRKEIEEETKKTEE